MSSEIDELTAEVIMAMAPGAPCPHWSAEDDVICRGAVLYDGLLYCTLEGVGIPLSVDDLEACPSGGDD